MSRKEMGVLPARRKERTVLEGGIQEVAVGEEGGGVSILKGRG